MLEFCSNTTKEKDLKEKLSWFYFWPGLCYDFDKNVKNLHQTHSIYWKTFSFLVKPPNSKTRGPGLGGFRRKTIILDSPTPDNTFCSTACERRSSPPFVALTQQLDYPEFHWKPMKTHKCQFMEKSEHANRPLSPKDIPSVRPRQPGLREEPGMSLTAVSLS